MHQKIIGGLVCTLMVISAIGTVSAITNKIKTLDTEIESIQTICYRDIILHPPWENNSWYNQLQSLYNSISEGNAFSNGYSGWVQVYSHASHHGPNSDSFTGWAITDSHFYHQTNNQQYITQYSGLHNFTFNYTYKGELYIAAPALGEPSQQSYGYYKINITFYITVITDRIEAYEKEVVISNGWITEGTILSLSYNQTIDVPFKSIYIPRNTPVLLKTQMDLITKVCGHQELLYSHGQGSFEGSLNKIKIEESQQHTPNKPNIPSGPTSGKIGKKYEYTFVTIDPDGDDIYYHIDWGDKNNNHWIGPYPSGEPIAVIYNWTQKGTYEIKVKAKDIYEAESDWSDSLSVAMSKYKLATSPLFFQVLERLIWYYPMLTNLLNIHYTI